MARLKRGSTALKKAERRAAGMGSINPDLDLGNGMTVKGFWDAINSMRQELITYNALLSTVDQVRHTVQEKEQTLSSLSERMLAAVAAKYGRDSVEYEMAGGSKRLLRRTAASGSQPAETLPEEPSPLVPPSNSGDATPAMA